ncbi:class I SAM-dependent methyltransferase, partial [Patescibacteria group bacterium]|nr:class I SAM-dependent methyltransferase [Patescibacteria group bacterium]
MSNLNRQAYDELATTYDVEVLTSIYQQHWHTKVLSLLKQWTLSSAQNSQSAAIAVDLGCGTGVYSKSLLEQGYRVFGVDQSASMLEIARQNLFPCYGDRFIPVLEDLIDFQGLENEASLNICFSAVLNHLRPDQWPMFIEKVYASLADDGLFLLDLENPFGIDYFFYTLYAYLSFIPIKPGFAELWGSIWCKLTGKPYSYSSSWYVGPRSVQLELHYKPLWSVQKLLRSSGFRILTVEGVNTFSCVLPRIALSEY